MFVTRIRFAFFSVCKDYAYMRSSFLSLFPPYLPFSLIKCSLGEKQLIQKLYFEVL